MKSLEGIEVTQGSDSELSKLVCSARQIFLIAVSDDLKMPRAAAAMFDIVKASEKEVRKGDEVDVVGLGWAKSCLLEVRSCEELSSSLRARYSREESGCASNYTLNVRSSFFITQF